MHGIRNKNAENCRYAYFCVFYFWVSANSSTYVGSEIKCTSIKDTQSAPKPDIVSNSEFSPRIPLN